MSDDLVKRLKIRLEAWLEYECEEDAKIDIEAAYRIEQLQAAYDMMQLLPRAGWYYLKPETRAALENKNEQRTED